MNVVSLEISGNSVQEERSGKNLYNVYDIRDEDKGNGATIDNHDYITLEYDNTSGTSVKYTNYMTNANNDLKVNTKYFGVLEVKKISGTGTLCVTSQIGTNSQTNAYLLYDFANLSNNQKIKFNFTTIDDFSACYNFLRTFLKSDIGQSGSISFRISVFEDEPNLDTFEYEAYGAMPSPEYPSEIETVNTQANIIIEKENLLDKNNVNKLKGYIDNNGYFQYSQNCKILYLKCKEDTNYTIYSKYLRALAFTNTIPKTGVTSNNFKIQNTEKLTLNSLKNTYLCVWYYSTSVENLTEQEILDSIKIQEGTNIEQQTKTVDIQQEMLEGDYFVKETDGWKEVHGWNKLIFTGAENWFKSGSSTSEIFAAAIDIENAVVGYGYSNYFKYYGNIAIGYFSVYNNGTNIRFCVDSLVITDLNSFKTWLAQKYNEGNPVYVWHKLATPTKLVCTETQNKQLDDLLNTSTYKNVTHIYSTDKVSPIIKVIYKKDLDTMLNNQQNAFDTRLSNIEKLLSTTTTSALLLDNLQTDLEKEVI